MMLGLVFHVISIFYLHRALDKIHTWGSLLMEKSLLRKDQRWKKVLGKKKKAIEEREKKERVPFCPEKKFLCESDWYCWSSTLTSDFEQRSRRQTKICHLMYFSLVFEVIRRTCFALTPGTPFIVLSTLLLVGF